MQFPWLEELVKKGHVSEVERDGIYSSCAQLVKTASTAGWSPEHHAMHAELTKKYQAQFMQKAKIPGAIAMMALPFAVSKIYGRHQESKAIKSEIAAIAKNRETLLAHPDFAPDRAKAEARFDEIAGLAPTVAQNPTLMGRLLKDKLHSGLTSDDVNTLAIIQSSYTPKYSYQEKLTKKAAEEQLGETAADMLLVCAEAGLCKTAKMGILGVPSGVSKVLSNILMATAVPTLYGVGRGVVDHLSEMRNKTVREKRLTESFQEALQSPEGESLRNQPEKARQAFQTLAHFSPNVAMQPTAARSFMKKLVDYKGDVHSGDLRDLTDIEKNMRGSGPSTFLKGFREGADAAGFKDALKSGVAPVTGAYSRQLEMELATSLGVNKKDEGMDQQSRMGLGG